MRIICSHLQFNSINCFLIILIYRRNLNRALTILEMIKRREKTKREHVHLGVEIFEKRFQSRDFNGHLLAEFTSSAVKSSRYYTSIQRGYRCGCKYILIGIPFLSSGLVGLHLRQFMVINTQANRINHGRMPVHSFIPWLPAMPPPVRHKSTSGAVLMAMPGSPIIFERRNVNTRNENIKISATNRHIQRLVICPIQKLDCDVFIYKLFLLYFRTDS